jgi:hypothetical protein
MSVRPRPTFVPLFALAAALVASGCGSDNSIAPGFIDAPGHIVAATVPESLAAGATVAVSVDLGSLGCGQSFHGFSVAQITGRDAWVAPIVRTHLGELACPAFLPPRSIVDYHAREPSSGTLTLHLVGAGDTLTIPLTASVGPGAAEHRVELVPRSSITHVDSLDLSWFYGPAVTAVTVARTDAHGVAIATLPCQDLDGNWELYVFNRPSSQLVPLCGLRQDMSPCVRALRTIVPYGQASAPSTEPATGWRSRAAMYSAGNPWWRNPSAMALR